MSPCGGVAVDGVVSDCSTALVTRLVNCRLLVHHAGCLVHRAVHRWEARSSPAKSASHGQGHWGPASARVRCPCRPLLSRHQSPFPHPLPDCGRRPAGKLLDLGPIPSGRGGPRVRRRSSERWTSRTTIGGRGVLFSSSTEVLNAPRPPRSRPPRRRYQPILQRIRDVVGLSPPLRHGCPPLGPAAGTPGWRGWTKGQ